MSIQLNLNGLSFCITNLDTNEVIDSQQIQYYQPIALAQLDEELISFLNKYKVIEHSYKKIVVIHNNPWYSLVPSSLFEAEHLSDYLKYNTALLANDNPAVDYLADLDTHVVYIPFTHVNNKLLDYFTSFDYVHHSSVLLKKLHPVQKQDQKHNAYVYIEGHSMSLTIFKGKNLMLFNVFEIQHSEELLYYLLFSIEQLNLAVESINLQLFGTIKKGDRTHKRISEFIPEVNFYIPDLPYAFKDGIAAEQIELLSLIAP